jgi:hypothetical protein
MTPNPTEFRRGAIAPMECIKEGWALIKDQYWLFLGIRFAGAHDGWHISMSAGKAAQSTSRIWVGP